MRGFLLGFMNFMYSELLFYLCIILVIILNKDNGRLNFIRVFNLWFVMKLFFL